MDVKPDRMVHLGYGKYWRSDAIVGLMPIDQDRGPGRRTDVYTATLEQPITASRSQHAILQDMAIASDEAFKIQDVPDVLRRMLATEAHLDVDMWVRRLRSAGEPEGAESLAGQSDLFD